MQRLDLDLDLDLAAIDRLRTAIIDFIRTLAGLIATIVQYAIRRPRRKAALAAEYLCNRPFCTVIAAPRTIMYPVRGDLSRLRR